MNKQTRMTLIGAGALVLVYVVSSVVQSITSRDRAPLAGFTSEPGRFVIMLPQGVSADVDILETTLGELAFHTYKARSKFVQFIVAYVDYPAWYIEESGPGQLLKNAATSSADNFNGSILDEKAFMHDDQAIREVLIRAPKGVYVRSRITISGNRLYQMMAISTRRRIRDPRVAEVFSSMRIHAAPASAPADSAIAGE